MSARWALLLALSLPGCGGGYVGQTEPDAPPQCHQEANADPAVRELRMKMAGTSWWRTNYQNQLAFAEHEALLKCMRRIGMLPPGGVEPVKPLWYGPLF
jgi:hypothetical protein